MTHKGLLVECALLLFVLDICDPWLDTMRIPEDILLVYHILVGLEWSIIVSHQSLKIPIPSPTHDQVKIRSIGCRSVHLGVLPV